MLINRRNRNLKVTTNCSNLTKTKYDKIKYDDILGEFILKEGVELNDKRK